MIFNHQIKIREQDTVNNILDYLTLRRIGHVHVRNTGAIVQRGGGKMHFYRPRNSQVGAPDIVFCFNGWAVACEVKSPVGKLSEHQIAWLDRWKKEPTSGSYLVARSVEDVDKFIGGLCAR